MAATAKLGLGTVVTIAGISLPKILSIDIDGGELGMIDASNMDTTAGSITPQIAEATRKGGTVTLNCEYCDEVAITGDEVAYSITPPSPFAAITGNCIVQNWKSGIPHDGKMTTDIKFTRVS
jgi:hypothetical protein